MFRVTKENEMGGRCHRYAVFRGGMPLPFSDVLDLWQSSDSFRSFFVRILADSPFTVYRWETPPIDRATVERPFEFVLVDSPELDYPADPVDFQEYFSPQDQGIVRFENLGRDALMVVPSPRGAESVYGHLAEFLRNGPAEQVHDLWKSVGEAVHQRIDDRPLWLSTAGGGVAWLHVRLDSWPKYYAYAPYKRVEML